MKLNKLLMAASIASLAFASCESEFTKDAELNVNVMTNESVNFDGQTITAKKRTPVEFLFSGNPDFLTFFSGENGKKYEYRERTTVDESEIESSTLKFTLTPQYGNPAGILTMYVSSSFPGIEKGNFTSDSILVEQHSWEVLIPPTDFPTTLKSKTYEIDMKSYIGKRIAIAICYKGQNKNVAQSKFTFSNMQIVNSMSNGQKNGIRRRFIWLYTRQHAEQTQSARPEKHDCQPCLRHCHQQYFRNMECQRLEYFLHT